MKKYLIFITIILLFFEILMIIWLKEKNTFNNLVLQNIECLATPENPVIECHGLGSLDCPMLSSYKAKYIW